MVHVVATQGDQRCRHLHLNLVADGKVSRLGYRDHHAAQAYALVAHGYRAVEGVRIHITCSGFRGIFESLPVQRNGLEAINLHIGAQRVIEGNVAARMLSALSGVRRVARPLNYLGRNVIEYLFQLISVRGRLVEVGTIGTRTQVPIPASPESAVLGIGGFRVVAGNRMHEFVFVACSRRISRGICTAEDANGIHGGFFILHVFRCGYRAAGNLRLESARRSRRTVGEEDNDLLGIFAVRGLAIGKLQAVVGTRGTGGVDGVNGVPECGRIRARGHGLHNLAVVIFVSASIVRVVAYSSRFIARKLHDGNLMLL